MILIRALNMRLLLTRPVDDISPLKEKLEKAGFEVIAFPLIEIVLPSDDGKALEKTLKNLKEYDMIVFTSPNAVRAVGSFLKKIPKGVEVIAVGPKTAAEAKSLSSKVTQPDTSRGGRGLITYFKARNIIGDKIFYPRSSIGREDLADALKAMGGRVDSVEAYQTEPVEIDLADLRDILKASDVVLFFSPSAVENYARYVAPRKSPPVIPFGGTTARALKVAGYSPFFVPAEASEDFFVTELQRVLLKKTDE